MAEAPAPRYLIRRALAFAIDHFLAMVLVTLAFLPFAASGLRLPQPLAQFRTITCTDLETPPDWLALTLAEPRFGALRVCENRLWGLSNGRELVAVYSELRRNGARVTSLNRTPVGPDLQPTGIRDLSAASVLALMALLSAAFTARGWPTPGKALARLRVTGTGRPWLREALRLGPMVALTALPALMPLEPRLWPFAAVLGASALGALALTWYYLWPFAHWTGQARHDRLAGFQVTAATAAPGRPPAPK